MKFQNNLFKKFYRAPLKPQNDSLKKILWCKQTPLKSYLGKCALKARQQGHRPSGSRNHIKLSLFLALKSKHDTILSSKWRHCFAIPSRQSLSPSFSLPHSPVAPAYSPATPSTSNLIASSLQIPLHLHPPFFTPPIPSLPKLLTLEFPSLCSPTPIPKWVLSHLLKK